MVRFARAEGSKGSNKKQYEDATPWTEIVSQLETSKKKRKKNQDEEDNEKKDGILGQVANKKKKIDTGKQETRLQNASHSAFQITKNQKNDKENGQPVLAVQNAVKKTKKGKKKGPKTSVPEYTISSEGKKVKVFRDGTERTWFDLPYEESDTMTRYDGMWVKKDMVEKLNCLKAALQEEGLDEKGIMRKMMKAKRKAHQKLRIELIYQQKNLVSEAAGEKNKNDSGSKNNPPQKNKKKNQKQVVIGNGSLSSLNKGSSVQLKKNKCKQLEEQSTREQIHPEVEQMTGENDSVQEDDTRVMISQTSGEVQKRKRKDIVGGSKKTPSQVNGNKRKEGRDCMTVLTTQDDGKVKKKLKKDTLHTETIEEQINIGDKDDDKMTDTLQTNSKVKKNIKSKKAKLAMKTLPSQTNNENEAEDKEKSVTPQPESEKKKKEKDEIEITTPHSDNKKKNSSSKTEMSQSPINTQQKTEADETFETHDYKTNKMENASSFQGDFEENELMTNFDEYWVLRKDVEALEAAKVDELETIYATRTDGSRGELTKEEKILLQRAVKKRKRFYHRKLVQKLNMGKRVMNNRKGKKDTKNEDSGIVVKFDGFFVKKEAADRLHKLRSKLYKEGLSQEEVDKLIKKERRKEERVLKNERSLVCLNCRQPGHMVSACPSIAAADGEGQPSICYTCGSTEHTSSSCNLKKGSEKSFSFATCYICKESGHISRQCPDNPRGLYPRGGACRGCGSVEHLAKDCPDLQKENAEYTIKVGRMKGEELEALDENDEAGDQDTSPSPSKWTKCKTDLTLSTKMWIEAMSAKWMIMDCGLSPASTRKRLVMMEVERELATVFLLA
ncbi:Zinc finger CCHC domain-containing protein 9 [Portunus trituberculatus]|uniref:Zinc finger CCHC domain-containing protein 9 n=1 Tax=Portunus trituberculatus TaxID=210409 RepID=A0A5B7CEC3_PORTR|nr:Zinc finger CCHC domain-containing protein 9 [Portunus trituberculatus]